MRLYHYSDSTRAESIQREGILPRSDPLLVARHIPEDMLTEVVKSMKGRGYVATLDHPAPQGWVEYGLLDTVLRHVTIDVGFSPMLFSFELASEQGVYVREHAFFTPRDYPGKFKVLEETAAPRKDYLNSTVSLSNYDGNFKAPEFWVPLPQKNIRVDPLPQKVLEWTQRNCGRFTGSS